MAVAFGGSCQSRHVTRYPQTTFSGISYHQYLGDGSLRQYSIPFPYIAQPDVRVYLNGILRSVPQDYSFINANTIEFRDAPLVGQLIEIRRETTLTSALVTYQNGSILTQEDLNLATIQNLYLNQEGRDIVDLRIGGAVSRIAAGTTILTVQPQDLINAAAQSILESTLLTELNSRIGDIDLNAEAILNESIRIDQLQAIIDFLEGGSGSLSTLIVNEQNARIAGDAAIVSDMTLLGAKSQDGLSWLLDLTKVKVDATTSIGTRFSSIESSANRVRTFRQASAPVSPQTGDIWIDTDSSPANLAFRWSGTAWEAIDNADIAINKAAIVTEQTARADGDTALASSISTLTTTVNGNTSSISTLQSVQNGLIAQYMVKLDVNGYVSGFGLYNQGSSAQFIVLADKFAVVTPGQAAKVPFSIVDGVVYMQNVVIGGALIQDATIGTLKLANGAATEIFVDFAAGPVDFSNIG